MNHFSFIAALLVAILLGFTGPAYSQNDTLSVNGPKRSRHFVNGEKICVLTAGRNVKGVLTILSDSTISIGSDTIAVSQVESIIGKRRNIKRIVGTTLTGMGAAGDAATITGIFYIMDKSYGGFLGGVDAFVDRFIVATIGASSIIVTTVGVIFLVRNKKYKSTRYTYAIH